MVDIDVIKTEIDTDPLVRGYSTMSDAQVADDMNTEYRTIKKKVPVSEIQSYAIKEDLYVPIKDAISHVSARVKAAANIFNDLGSMSFVDLDFELTKTGETTSQIELMLDALVAGITEFTGTHKTEVLALADMNGSRAQELRISRVTPSIVADAKRLP